MREQINESVDVISVFYSAKKSVEPLRMRWRNRSYKIRQTHTLWASKSGQGHEQHFSVELDTGDIAEPALQIEKTTPEWKFIKLHLTRRDAAGEINTDGCLPFESLKLLSHFIFAYCVKVLRTTYVSNTSKVGTFSLLGKSVSFI